MATVSNIIRSIYFQEGILLLPPSLKSTHPWLLSCPISPCISCSQLVHHSSHQPGAFVTPREQQRCCRNAWYSLRKPLDRNCSIHGIETLCRCWGRENCVFSALFSPVFYLQTPLKVYFRVLVFDNFFSLSSMCRRCRYLDLPNT